MTPEERFQRIDETLERVGKRLDDIAARQDKFEIELEIQNHAWNERFNQLWKAHSAFNGRPEHRMGGNQPAHREYRTPDARTRIKREERLEPSIITKLSLLLPRNRCSTEADSRPVWSRNAGAMKLYAFAVPAPPSIPSAPRRSDF